MLYSATAIDPSARLRAQICVCADEEGVIRHTDKRGGALIAAVDKLLMDKRMREWEAEAEAAEVESEEAEAETEEEADPEAGAEKGQE